MTKKDLSEALIKISELRSTKRKCYCYVLFIFVNISQLKKKIILNRLIWKAQYHKSQMTVIVIVRLAIRLMALHVYHRTCGWMNGSQGAGDVEYKCIPTLYCYELEIAIKDPRIGNDVWGVDQTCPQDETGWGCDVFELDACILTNKTLFLIQCGILCYLDNWNFNMSKSDMIRLWLSCPLLSGQGNGRRGG